MTFSELRAGESDTRTAIVDAARTVVSQRGLSGMSLRVVAEQADVSVGTINYRIGDRAALLEAVTRREIELARAHRQAWRDRVGQTDPLDAGALPDLVCAWLDDGAWDRRVSAINQCELTLKALRDPQSLPSIGPLLEEGESLWRAILHRNADADRLATLIASYCTDEQPFSILLASDVEYRLLRRSTIRALLHDPRKPRPRTAGDWHMRLVDRLAIPSQAARDPGAVAPQGMKSVITEHIADALASAGVGALSHRLVAQTANMPASTVAHHFPTQRDVVRGGVEALYRRMRAELTPPPIPPAPATSGKAVMLLTHETGARRLEGQRLHPLRNRHAPSAAPRTCTPRLGS